MSGGEFRAALGRSPASWIDEPASVPPARAFDVQRSMTASRIEGRRLLDRRD